MKRKFLIVAFLIASTCGVLILGHVKMAKANSHVFEPGNGAGYYLTWEDNCKKCLHASTSCNVSSQCCRSWGDCN